MTPLLAIIGGVGWQELLIILVIVLLVFGPKRLPDIAESMGKSIKKFRSATRDASDEVRRELDEARRDLDTDEHERRRERDREPAPRPDRGDDRAAGERPREGGERRDAQGP
ncbi:MAG: twin-arginine translocase TatA/TatE family subunit [Candidatus Krumholzibacteriia bacterium]